MPIAAHFANNFASTLIYYTNGKDSMIAPSEAVKLSFGYILGWSIVLAIIFAATMKLTIEYKRRLSRSGVQLPHNNGIQNNRELFELRREFR